MPGQVYHLSFATHLRHRLFVDPDAASAAARCFLLRHERTASAMLAWVLMPDHAHCLLQLGRDCALQEVVARLKGRCAREVNRALERSGPVWGRAYYDRALRAEDDLRAVARYIVANPLRAGLVTRLGDYPYWDAAWLD